MRKEDKIVVNGVEIIVKELTVAEVRHWMMDMVEREKSENEQDTVSAVVDQGLFEDIGLEDICRMSSLEKSQLDDFTPSELQVIIQKCRGLNPDFFGMRKRLLGLVPKNLSSG